MLTSEHQLSPRQSHRCVDVGPIPNRILVSFEAGSTTYTFPPEIKRPASSSFTSSVSVGTHRQQLSQVPPLPRR